MVLYHLKRGFVPFDVCEEVVPSVPFNRLPLEDATQTRICVSSSLDGCVTSIGITDLALNSLCRIMKQQKNPNRRTLFEALKFPFTVMEFEAECDSEGYWPTEKVSDYVPDAVFTNESWFIKPMRPCRVSYLWLTGGKIVRIPVGNVGFLTMVKNTCWADVDLPLEKSFLDSLCSEVMDYLLYESMTSNEYRLKSSFFGFGSSSGGPLKLPDF